MTAVAAMPGDPRPLPGLPVPDRPPRTLYGAHSLSERRGVLVCHCQDRNGNPVSPEWTYWRDLAEARQARDALTPCGPQCGGIHTCVEVDVPTRRSMSLQDNSTH
jgi:hypothetical protein